MEPDVPCVPHLFVQRIDALPDDVLEGVLSALAASQPEPKQRPGFFQSLGWGNNANTLGVDKQLNKAELRKLLQKHRRDELAADADTADFSSEPYDSIPRQVQLQWRLYARLYPDAVAEGEKLATMLQPPGPNGKPPTMTGADNGQRNGAAAGRARADAGPSTFFGLLPPVTALQRAVSNSLEPRPADDAVSPLFAAARRADDAAAAVTSATSASGSTAGRAAGAAGPGGSSRSGPGGAPLAAAVQLQRQSDPIFLTLSRSLDEWYELNRQQMRPLRRGRRARLLVVRGVDLPADWKDAMRPTAATAVGAVAVDPARAQSGPRLAGGLVRACTAAVGAVAGVLSLRHRPQVWEVGTGPGAGAGMLPSEDWRRGREQGDRRARGERGGLRGAASAGSGSGGGAAAAAGGRGLVAAQAAARGMGFALRRTTLIPPEWLSS